MPVRTPPSNIWRNEKKCKPFIPFIFSFSLFSHFCGVFTSSYSTVGAALRDEKNRPWKSCWRNVTQGTHGIMHHRNQSFRSFLFLWLAIIRNQQANVFILLITKISHCMRSVHRWLPFRKKKKIMPCGWSDVVRCCCLPTVASNVTNSRTERRQRQPFLVNEKSLLVCFVVRLSLLTIGTSVDGSWFEKKIPRKKVEGVGDRKSIPRISVSLMWKVKWLRWDGLRHHQTKFSSQTAEFFRTPSRNQVWSYDKPAFFTKKPGEPQFKISSSHVLLLIWRDLHVVKTDSLMGSSIAVVNQQRVNKEGLILNFDCKSVPSWRHWNDEGRYDLFRLDGSKETLQIEQRRCNEEKSER